jgi:hypothetical protein
MAETILTACFTPSNPILSRQGGEELWTFYETIISGTQHYPVGCPDFSPASWPQAALISCPRLSLSNTV